MFKYNLFLGLVFVIVFLTLFSCGVYGIYRLFISTILACLKGCHEHYKCTLCQNSQINNENRSNDPNYCYIIDDIIPVNDKNISSSVSVPIASVVPITQEEY